MDDLKTKIVPLHRENGYLKIRLAVAQFVSPMALPILACISISGCSTPPPPYPGPLSDLAQISALGEQPGALVIDVNGEPARNVTLSQPGIWLRPGSYEFAVRYETVSYPTLTFANGTVNAVVEANHTYLVRHEPVNPKVGETVRFYMIDYGVDFPSECMPFALVMKKRESGGGYSLAEMNNCRKPR